MWLFWTLCTQFSSNTKFAVKYSEGYSKINKPDIY